MLNRLLSLCRADPDLRSTPAGQHSDDGKEHIPDIDGAIGKDVEDLFADCQQSDADKYLQEWLFPEQDEDHYSHKKVVSVSESVVWYQVDHRSYFSLHRKIDACGIIPEFLELVAHVGKGPANELHTVSLLAQRKVSTAVMARIPALGERRIIFFEFAY